MYTHTHTHTHTRIQCVLLVRGTLPAAADVLHRADGHGSHVLWLQRDAALE